MITGGVKENCNYGKGMDRLRADDVLFLNQIRNLAKWMFSLYDLKLFKCFIQSYVSHISMTLKSSKKT